MNAFLQQLSTTDGYVFFAMLQKIGKDENAFTNPVCGMSFEEYQQWLKQQDDWSKGENLPSGYVGQTVFWLMVGEIPVGIGKIRKADEMGIEEKVLTVEKYNYASKKVIENNGGILYDENEFRWYFEF